MENASKALIIAGAILISIVIISLGILVVNNARSAIGSDSGLTDAQIQAYNSKFDSYVGSAKSATEVRNLLNAISSNNIQESTSEDNRCIGVLYTAPGAGGVGGAAGSETQVFGAWNVATGTYGDDGVQVTQWTAKTGADAVVPNIPMTSTYKVTGIKNSQGIFYCFRIAAN